MAEVSKCPYCNQPLVSDTARKHLRREEEKLRRQLQAEARADAKKQIEKVREATEKKVRAELEGQQSKHERALERTIQGLQKQNTNLDRKLEQAGKAIEKKVRAELEGQQSKHERALEGTIHGLQKQNTDLERKLEKLSAPERGELNEADIAEQLEHAFPDDEIERTGKGGGDIVQTVRCRSGNGLETAGVILYECKDAKQWGNRFITQIKAGGRKLHTPYLLLVSQAMPAKEADVCVRDDVVITDPEHVRHLSRILRQMVMETHRAELAGLDRNQKTELLYEYLRGEVFRGELASLIEVGTKLTEMLQTERSAHERDWNKRQQTYDELLHNSVAIDQSIRGIIESKSAASRRAPRRRARSSPAGAAAG